MSNNNTKTQQSPLVWIDCEMTGLDPRVDELIEIAVIVTDSELVPLGAGLDLVIKPSSAALAQMGPFVTQMHTDSGLIEELDAGITLEQAEEEVLSYIRGYVPTPGLAPLAGNSVGQDARFLREYMPRLMDYLHYRIVDVSTIKELAKRWYPRVYVCAPDKNGRHRALGDIEDSIVELRYYRSALFPADLNPQKGAYHALAQQVVDRARREFQREQSQGSAGK